MVKKRRRKKKEEEKTAIKCLLPITLPPFLIPRPPDPFLRRIYEKVIAS
jgi:hypothetical protein